MNTKDIESAIRLLRMWHEWAAHYFTAPQEIRCFHCQRLLGAVYEPDAMRLPGAPLDYSEEHCAFPVDSKYYRYEPDIPTMQRHVTRSSGIRFGYSIPREPHTYRLPLPVAIACDRCGRASMIERPKWKRLNELRKVIRRLGNEERAAVETAYGALCEATTSRCLSLTDTADPWPFATPQQVIGYLPPSEINYYYREDEAPSRANYSHVSGRVDTERTLCYNISNSKHASVRGGYHIL